MAASTRSVFFTEQERIQFDWYGFRYDGSCVDDARTFHLLADSTRDVFADALLYEKRCTSDLAGIFGFSKSAASQDFRVPCMVHDFRHDPRALYTLDDGNVRILLSLTVDRSDHPDSMGQE